MRALLLALALIWLVGALVFAWALCRTAGRRTPTPFDSFDEVSAVEEGGQG